MKKFIVERNIPGAGKLREEELKTLADRSATVIAEMGAPYHWVHTYVTDNKLYCVHIAPDKETVVQHSCQVGYPVDNIAEIRLMIDASTSAMPIKKEPRRVFE